MIWHQMNKEELQFIKGSLYKLSRYYHVFKEGELENLL